MIRLHLHGRKSVIYIHGFDIRCGGLQVAYMIIHTDLRGSYDQVIKKYFRKHSFRILE